MRYQQCQRCIMDNASDKTIKFDNDGNCNYCTEALKRMPLEYYPNVNGEKRLSDIFNDMKDTCRNEKYDCLVGVSGGIDSSYILYLGNKYGLRMLAVHVDDGLDNSIATENMQKLIDKTETDFLVIKPDRNEYVDLLKTLFKASVPNLAIVQDNLINSIMHKFGEENKIHYILNGANFAHECILERSGGVNASDKKYILALQKEFEEMKIRNLEFVSLTDRYIKRSFLTKVKYIRPLNYFDYNLDDAIKELNDFCGFTYYGGKHYESILTRFLQNHYLPVKFGKDKRKSHYSSLIVSGQLTREEALKRMDTPLYESEKLLTADKQVLADFLDISVKALDEYIALEPREERSYPHSILNELAPIARRFRRLIE